MKFDESGQNILASLTLTLSISFALAVLAKAVAVGLLWIIPVGLVAYVMATRVSGVPALISLAVASLRATRSSRSFIVGQL